jgi:hypothetical protein
MTDGVLVRAVDSFVESMDFRFELRDHAEVLASEYLLQFVEYCVEREQFSLNSK